MPISKYEELYENCYSKIVIHSNINKSSMENIRAHFPWPVNNKACNVYAQIYDAYYPLIRYTIFRISYNWLNQNQKGRLA